MGYGRKMEISVGFKELGILAKKYVQNSKMLSFNNILDFSLWVEDNNLAETLGIKGEEDEEDEEIIKEDKNSRKYRTKVLALKILQLPEVQKELKQNPDIHTGNIYTDKWQEWARKARDIG